MIRALVDWLRAVCCHLLAFGPGLLAVPEDLLAKVNTFRRNYPSYTVCGLLLGIEASHMLN